MSRRLELASWPRRASFEHFRSLANPYFSVCVSLDLSGLAVRCRVPLTLAYHWLTLAAANAVEPLRMRLDGDGVIVHDQVHGSMTVLRRDESLTFAPLAWRERFADFEALAAPCIAAARRGEVPLDARRDDTALVHFTVLPWLDFTSFSHARDRGDSVPKIAFGRIVPDGSRRRMAMAIDVHHALVDGLHVGRFVELLQRSLAEPPDELCA